MCSSRNDAVAKMKRPRERLVPELPAGSIVPETASLTRGFFVGTTHDAITDDFRTDSRSTVDCYGAAGFFISGPSIQRATGAADDPENPYVVLQSALFQCPSDLRRCSWQSRRASTWIWIGRGIPDVTFAQHMATGQGITPLGLTPRRHVWCRARRSGTVGPRYGVLHRLVGMPRDGTVWRKPADSIPRRRISVRF